MTCGCRLQMAVGSWTSTCLWAGSTRSVEPARPGESRDHLHSCRCRAGFHSACRPDNRAGGLGRCRVAALCEPDAGAEEGLPAARAAEGLDLRADLCREALDLAANLQIWSPAGEILRLTAAGGCRKQTCCRVLSGPFSADATSRKMQCSKTACRDRAVWLVLLAVDGDGMQAGPWGL